MISVTCVEVVLLQIATTLKNLQGLTSESNDDFTFLIAPYIELDHFLLPLLNLVSSLGRLCWTK